jgi:NhaC family Na+:H+ antiporter
MAKGGNVNLNIIAGAIIAGAYFGDRCSPMSSSANLVAHLTETNFHKNIRNMFKTSAIPFVLSIILYTTFSLQQPFTLGSISINNEIMNSFNTNWIVLLPAIIIIILSLFKIDVKISMLLSILLASIISILLQQYKLTEILKFILLGFKLDSTTPLQNIIKGGGIISMLKPSLVVFISCSLAGIFDGTNMLKNIEDILSKSKNRFELFLYTTITSIATGAFGCNQSIAIVLTSSLMKKPYNEKNIDNHTLAIDLENTAVVLSALIPWNIAAFVPTTTMNVSNIGYIPYAFYLYLIPICNIIYFRFLKTKTFQKNLE